MLWLTILTIFSFGSDYASALVIHAMLAALVSLRRPYLIRSDGGRSVAGALTYAAALSFGPGGGMVVGAVAKGKLHLIIYTGARRHYFPKYRDDVDRMMDSIQIQ